MRKKLWISLLLFIFIAGGALWYYKNASSFPQAPMGMPVPEVTTVTLKSEDIDFTKDFPGRVSAYRIAEIRPQVTGIITQRLFKEGSFVLKGQQLYQIDPAPYRAVSQAAEADLLKAQANLTSVQAKATRYGTLNKIGGISKQEYDDVTATLAQAKADIAIANAKIKTAKIDLDYTKLFSPISGRVGKSFVTEGALVTKDQSTPLALIQQLDKVYVDVTQSSTDFLTLRKDLSQNNVTEDAKSVTLLLRGDAEIYSQKGVLQFSDVTVDPSTETVQMRIVFPNPNYELLAGLFVKARLSQKTQDNALLVPQQSIMRNPNGDVTVWLVSKNNKAILKTIKISEAIGDKYLVREGLKSGDRVVLEGIQKIQPNANVKPIEFGTKPTSQPQSQSH